MEVVIALRPRTERGRGILDEFEQVKDMRPDHVADDGTRRYHLDTPDADIDALDPVLDSIDPDWRNHVTSWRVDGG